MVFDRLLKTWGLLQTAADPKIGLEQRFTAIRDLHQMFSPERDIDLLEGSFHRPGTTLATRELIIEVLARIGGSPGLTALMRLLANFSLDARLRFLAFQAAQRTQPRLNAENVPNVVETYRPPREELLRLVDPHEVYNHEHPGYACSAACCADEPYLTRLRLLADALLGQVP